MRHRFWSAALLFAALGCRGDGHDRATAAGNVVDSVFPMDVLLARFRKDLPKPAALHGEVTSRDTLVQRVVTALAANDTLAFEHLAVTRDEWAWLFFPTNVLSRPPYELPPGLAWFQLQENNRQGVFRALREFGGRKLDYRGYDCADQPTVEGDNKIWIGCEVRLARDGAEPSPIRLFSAILERGGRFLILSYANDF
jgi:hypothetical protein